MFDLDGADELELLAETAREFARARLAPRLRESEQARGVAPELRAAWDQIGLSGLEWPESLGGAGLGPLARVLVNEELGAGDAGAALALDGLGPCVGALLELGGEGLLREIAATPAGGEGARGAVIVADRAPDGAHGDGLRATGPWLSADAVGGTVPWVPADAVDLLVVLSDGGALVATEGLVPERLPGSGLRAAGAAALVLDGVRGARRFGDPCAVGRALARARLYTASLLLGVLRHACDFSRAYALERRAFGRPIAHHQALAFLLVDMRAALDGARLLVQEAAWRAESGAPFEGEAAAAFAETIEAARSIGPAGVQVLGGHGFMRDYPVEKLMREARALGLLLGGEDAAREDAGRALCTAPGRVRLSVGEVA
jgi:alkylation response protein AidB-like acyl-CoA dehydrogenase